MNSKPLRQSALILAALGSSLFEANAQGYSPAEAAAHATLPAGLEVKLAASEPTIAQPVAIEFDDRGRLWVIQYLQYPNPAGLQRVKVDRFSRTAYDKVPEPPPRGPKGADRVTILADIYGGHPATTSKDFVNGLNLTSGLAFGRGGVFVLQIPYLLFYPDKNGDDIPDSDPEVLLSGFGMEDAHSVANSLTWGPDGWLYGCQGSTVTANIRGIEFQQGVWRYHPITHRFELFCEGGGNSWGLDFDEDGELIYSTNLGPYRMLHGVQGGYYWKSFGKHGALHNPYTYGYFEHVPHKNFTGGHVTVGGIIYQGDALPQQFRGKYIAGDLLGHAVQWHTLEPWGSSFKSSYGGELLTPNDTWFASSDVTMGPNGSVYVADWFDKRTAHPDPDADWDRSNGRVYEIKSKEPMHDSVTANLRSSEIHNGVFDLQKLPSSRLLELLSSKNDWFVKKARRVLADRRDPSVIAPLRKQVLESPDDQLALESLWALYVSGGFNDQWAEKLLLHRSAAIRRWTVRFLGDENKVSTGLGKKMIELAGSETDVHVRAQLASTAKRISAEQALPIIHAILARNLDRDDPYVPLLLWWGIEKHAIASLNPITKMFASSTAWSEPLTRDIILPRLMRRYAAEATRESFAACASLLKSAPDDAAKHAMLTALHEGLPAGVKGGEPRTRSLEQQVGVAWKENSQDRILIRVLTRLGNQSAIKRVPDLAATTQTAVDLRVAMLELMAQVPTAFTAQVPLACVKPTEPAVVQIAALSAIQSNPDAEISKLLAVYPSLNPPVKSKARDVFLSRKPWAGLFIKEIEGGRIPAREVPLDQLQKIALLGDEDLSEQVRKYWGNISPGTPEEKLADVRRFNNDLRAFPGDASPGHELFRKTCAVCHRLFGEGNQIGPELTGANRKDRDYLLVNIVDPSSIIRKEFVSYNVETVDGQITTGLIAEQTADSVTLLSASGERCVLPRARIKTLTESKISLMPEDLLHGLKPQELRDLFAYLQGDPPVAKSKTP